VTDGMEQWKDRVALVTGASSGIGAAVARVLAGAGMRVAICARRTERIEALAGDLGRAGGEVLAQPADLRREADILALFEAVRDRWGGVDVLVNNAGLGHASPLVDGDTEAWREMLEVNVLALCVCTREAVRDMRRRGDDGYVVHLSSMAGHRVPPGSGVYSATKFAVRALTEALRQELRRAESGIRVSEVSPGLVETEFHAHYFGSEEAAQRSYGRFPVLQPDDVARTIRHLLAQPPHVQIHDVLVRPTRQPN
jgi:NADP-dependent 3-hydroxy acid dehydrogenase YdfG